MRMKAKNCLNRGYEFHLQLSMAFSVFLLSVFIRVHPWFSLSVPLCLRGNPGFPI